MKIAATCECGARINVKPELAGKRLKCPKCGTAVKIPKSRAVADDDEEFSPEALLTTKKKTSRAGNRVPPRKSASRKKRNKSTKHRKSSGIPPAAFYTLCAGIPIVFLIIGAIVYIAVWGRPQGEPAPAVAKNDGVDPVAVKPPAEIPDGVAPQEIPAKPLGPPEPPQEEMAELERFTKDTFFKALDTMQRKEVNGTVKTEGRLVVFAKSYEYTGENGMTVKQLMRRGAGVGKQSQEIESFWNFEQKEPHFIGTFLASGGDWDTFNRSASVRYGSWRLHYPDGKLRAMGGYDPKGNRSGHFRFWYPSGNRRWDGFLGRKWVDGSDREGQIIWSRAYPDAANNGNELAADSAETVVDGHTTKIQDLVISDDGTRLVSAQIDGEVRIWNMAEKRLETHFQTVAGLRSIALWNNATILAVTGGSKDGGTSLWDISNARQIKSPIRFAACALSADGSSVFAAEGSSIVEYNLPDLVKRRVIVPSTNNLRLQELVISPRGRNLVMRGNRDVWIVDLDTLKARQIIDGMFSNPGFGFVGGKFSNDGSQFVVAPRNNTNYNHCYVAKLDSNETLELKHYHDYLVAVEPDTLTAIGSNKGLQRLTIGDPDKRETPLAGGQRDERVSVPGFPRGTFSADGKWFAAVLVSFEEEAGYLRWQVRLWDTSTWKPIDPVSINRSPMNVYFSKDGRFLVATDANWSISVWNIEKMRKP